VARQGALSGEGESAVNVREVNPLGWTGCTSLLGQVPRVVIEHRRKVEHDEQEPAKRDLSNELRGG
jgi:hypothetical protein